MKGRTGTKSPRAALELALPKINIYRPSHPRLHMGAVHFTHAHLRSDVSHSYLETARHYSPWSAYFRDDAETSHVYYEQSMQYDCKRSIKCPRRQEETLTFYHHKSNTSNTTLRRAAGHCEMRAGLGVPYSPAKIECKNVRKLPKVCLQSSSCQDVNSSRLLVFTSEPELGGLQPRVELASRK